MAVFGDNKLQNEIIIAQDSDMFQIMQNSYLHVNVKLFPKGPSWPRCASTKQVTFM